MKQLLVFMLLLLSNQLVAGSKNKMITITVTPKEASIFVNNQFVNYGLAKFQRPKKKEMVAIRIECEGYNPIFVTLYLLPCRRMVFIEQPQPQAWLINL